MTRTTAAILLGAALSMPAASLAKPLANAGSPQLSTQLRTALNAMVKPQASPPGQSHRPVDPDQGDEHASPIAIDQVCNGDTPAAQRSAICAPVSPD